MTQPSGQPPHYPPAVAGPQPPRKPPSLWQGLGTGGQVTLLLAAFAAPVLIIIVLLSTMKPGAPARELSVQVTSCDFAAGMATVEYRVTNSGERGVEATVSIEYRSNGARVDTDTSRVKVPAGDTAIGSESTFLPVDVTSGTCGASVR